MKSLAMDILDDDSLGGLNVEQPLMPFTIYVPDLLLQKNLQFHKDELIWDVKQQIIDSLPKELRESFNYGLFCPPINGKAGKFLDEHRMLADYPFPDPTGYLELRYKRRVYKMMHLEEKQIKQLHTRANLRRMLDYVHNGQVEKITKMCSRGMDPNFHCPESGETPLTATATLKQPAKVIMALVNGGALLDFRTKDGFTALHKAVEKNNFDCLKTLLDLGASPNYKDSRGLTSLYHTLLHSSDPRLTELLLHDHAFVGTCDPQGWQEVHQACKHGLVQHLEHLLFYGADMNAHNASGNTPLHVCAVNDQENCARVLLFRGADKDALNFANQSPYQVAIIAGNLLLGDIIKNHSPDDVVPYRETPTYNPRRRTSMAPVTSISRTHSDPRLELMSSGLMVSSGGLLLMKPPSPCPSNCSLPPFSSSSIVSSSCVSETSTSSHPSSDDAASASIVTEKSVTSESSSGVCTSNSGGYEGESSQFMPGTLCVCIEDYFVPLPGHLRLRVGDTLEIIGETEEDGLLEGRVADGQEGFFPTSVVLAQDEDDDENDEDERVAQRIEGRREINAKRVNPIPRRWKMPCVGVGIMNIVIRRQNNSLFKLHDGSGSSLCILAWEIYDEPESSNEIKGFGEPRTVVLHRGRRGFGFVLRGAKATSPLMERQPSEFWPSLQYLDDVDKGGVADQAGLKKGDFLLEINGHDVSQASHEYVVSTIKQSGDLVAMTVITVQGQPSEVLHRQYATLPRKLATKKAPVPPKRDPRTTLTVGRIKARSMVAGLAELEALDRSLCGYDSEGRSTKSSSVESLPNKHGVKGIIERPQNIASIRARPSSQRMSATELEQFFARQGSVRRPRSYSTIHSTRPSKTPKVYGSVAAMKRSKASRTKIGDIMNKIHKEFYSTPDLNNEITDIDAGNTSLKKKSQSQEDILNSKNNRHSWACSPNNFVNSCDALDNEVFYQNAWKSIEDVYRGSGAPIVVKSEESDIYARTLPVIKGEKSGRVSCPPPSHPPPPPPLGQVVQVDVSKALGDYANINILGEDAENNIMSSFRPGDSAKLYASPEVVMSVGYKTDPLPKKSMLEHQQSRRAEGGSSLRSQSLPPKATNGKLGGKCITVSSETENSGDSSNIYSTFKKNFKQKDSSSDSGHVSDRGTLRSLKGKQPVTNAYSSKFDIEESNVDDQQNYPALLTPGHEPFIPEPDYDSSEDDNDINTSGNQCGTLSTFGKGDEIVSEEKSFSNKHFKENEVNTATSEAIQPPMSPHTEAKRAIQEARERLRFSSKTPDKNATVVFISGKITERKVEKSEIQLIRTEEGRLTGTVVISTMNEQAEPLYLTSPIVKTDETDVSEVSRYPRRDAPASEYAKYRQKILGGANANASDPPSLASPDEVVENEDDLKKPVPEVKAKQTDAIESPTKTKDGLCIALTGAHKCPSEKIEENIPNSDKALPTSKDNFMDDVAENSSSGVSSDIEMQNEIYTASSTEEDSKAETVIHSKPPEVIRAKPLAIDNKKSFHEQAVPCRAEETKDIRSKVFTHQADILQRNAAESGLTSFSEERRKDKLPSKKIQAPAVTHEHKKTSISKNTTKKSAKLESSPEKSLEDSLEVLRLQVNSIGVGEVNEVDVFQELVPPPPEFAASNDICGSNKKIVSLLHDTIAPPPEFSDTSPSERRLGTHSLRRDHTSQLYPKNSSTVNSKHGNIRISPGAVDLALIASLCVNADGSRIMRKTLGQRSGSRGTSRLSGRDPRDLCGSDSEFLQQKKTIQKEFRLKPLQSWTTSDISDWLDSLFLSEYKSGFAEAGITGAKLANMDSNDLMGLGVKQMGHRLNMERSLKWYLK